MRLLLTTFLLATMCTFGLALTSSDITVFNGSGPYLYSDDGNCGSREMPNAAYVIVNVVNNTASPMNSIAVKMTSMSNTTNGFKQLSFLSDSTFVISEILPGDTVGAFFYIQYPCTKGLSTTMVFDISDATTSSVTFSTSMSTFDIAPTSAGGDVVAQDVIGTGALGILVADTVTFGFGNYNGGEMFFQPSGDTLFPVNNMELIRSKVIQSSFSSCGPKPGDINRFYYNGASGCGAGTGNTVTVVFFYISTNDTVEFNPYAGMKSGGPIKYMNNYGNGVAQDTFIITSNSNQFSLTKTASCGICTPGSTITYTVTISNGSSVDLMFDKILDSLPAGHSYVGFASGSDIDATNSSIHPTAGATGNILFTGLIPETTFPYRSYVVPGGGSLELKYEVEIPNTASSDLFENRAIGVVGSVSFDTAFAETCAGCSALPVTMLYFKGEVVGSTTELKWVTASENNNDGFDVYRHSAQNEKVWIDFVPGAGNSVVRKDYQLIDPTPIFGNTLYELVQKDYDGHTTSFFTAVNANSIEDGKITVYPNPMEDQLQVNLNAKSYEKATVQLFTLDGRMIVNEDISNVSQFSVDLREVPAGIYLLQVSGDDQILSHQKVYKK